jgi:hypothetical protein
MEMSDLLLWMITGITFVAVALSGVLLSRIYRKGHQS